MDKTITIKCIHEGFVDWVDLGMKIFGSGQYYHSGDTFKANCSFNGANTLVALVECWAKAYADEYAKLNGESISPASLYEIS